MIDKDMSAAFLAKQLHADRLLILTDADAVYLDWGKPTQHALRATTPSELTRYQFDEGSMGLKLMPRVSLLIKVGKWWGSARYKMVFAFLKGPQVPRFQNTNFVVEYVFKLKHERVSSRVMS